jgi:hypothetical protein
MRTARRRLALRRASWPQIRDNDMARRCRRRYDAWAKGLPGRCFRNAPEQRGGRHMQTRAMAAVHRPPAVETGFEPARSVAEGDRDARAFASNIDAVFERGPLVLLDAKADIDSRLTGETRGDRERPRYPARERTAKPRADTDSAP